ncbi:MAG TPA: hypothetical protein VMB35_01735 [Methanomicrobiales archaeon]|jgi:hypothetical protein|nr:hypothetical protein [Methanomicrobiales archaeon]
MTSKFGRGFVVPLILLAKHLGLPPDQAFFGAADHLDEMTLPEKFRGTEVDGALEHFRKAVIWHQAGTMDKEDYATAVTAMYRLAIAVDHELGIKDADIGSYD